MSDQKTYQGGCHCQAVRYEVTGDFSKPIYCNCSICSKSGTWLAFVPAEQFSLQSGEEMLTDYQFNKKIIHHYFCKVCGVRSFGRGMGPGGTPMVAVNVRCLDDIDLESIKPTFFDGKSR